MDTIRRPGGIIDSSIIVGYQFETPVNEERPGPWKARYIPFVGSMDWLPAHLTTFLATDGWWWYRVPNTVRGADGTLSEAGWWRSDEQTAITWNLTSLTRSPAAQQVAE